MDNKKIAIKFFAPVNEESIGKLISIIDNKINEGIEEIILLISTNGGSVFHGLSAYNYLKGLPIKKLTTHNFGSVDSIGVVIYCAGEERVSSPQARFLIHGVSMNFSQNINLEEPQLEEKLKSLKIDIENIAKVISVNADKETGEVIKKMVERTTLNPEQAKEWGLVHEIKSELFEKGVGILSI